MIHCHGIEVVSVASLEKSDGLWTFLWKTVHLAAVVPKRLRRCGVKEKVRVRWAFCRISRFGIESIPIPVKWQVRLVRNLAHIRHAQAQRIQGNTTRVFSFSLIVQAPACGL